MEGRWLSDEEYASIFSRVPRLCVDVVIRTDDGVLLTLRDIEPYKGEWHLPGGRVMMQEPVKDAVLRIAKAETGLDVEIDAELGHMEFPEEANGDIVIHTVSIAFLTHPVAGSLITDWQGKDGRFFRTLPQPTVREQEEFLKAHKLL